jgi:Leucine-rich repeat (LRR) protein
MKKCKGLPLAIVTIGGFLARQSKTLMEWKKLNSHIGAELEMNEGLKNIKNVLSKSYDGLPYHLKPCFLYLSIFPEDQDIKRTRLVRRWIAEGYSTEVLGKSVVEIAESHFMELIDRSMILPNKTTYFSQKVIDSCQVHDLMREISISKAAEENLVFRLEEGCSSSTNGTSRHLTISANWKGDQGDFERMVDVSRIRSLTVFGEWKPFFISDKMRFLRVLDLKDTSGLRNHHLEHIGKLVHLRYLSLKRCRGIYHLPDSMGNMRQLQTLDIRLTWIAMLPKTIVKLKQLQYLRLGGLRTDRVYFLDRLKSKCAAFCSCHGMDMEETWHDRCAKCWYVAMPGLATPFGRGTPVPRGAGNLKALHTLGRVDIGSGNALKEIKKLTQLRRLLVSGISKKNCQEFCSTLEVLRCLESLSVSSSGLNGSLSGLSHAVFSPPSNLRTLKLLNYLGKMPAWIMGIRNLVKLRLMYTLLTDSDGTMQLLGNLSDLSILTLDSYAFDVQGLLLNFVPEAFPSLVALDLCSSQTATDRGEIKSVEFKQGATPKLEMLKFRYCGDVIINDGLFSGLASLPRLKKIQLAIESIKSEEDSIESKEAFVEHVRAQLALNQNRPVLIKEW